MIRIERAEDSRAFADVMRLLDIMAPWDVEMSRPLGFTEEEILSAFYGESAESLASTWGSTDAMMLLAREGDGALGCVALRIDGPIGKIDRFFVDPAARGRGIGGRLLDTAIAILEERGATRVRLLTATFMHAAHALYRSRGFVLCEPFEDVGERLLPSTLFMERQGAP